MSRKHDVGFLCALGLVALSFTVIGFRLGLIYQEPEEESLDVRLAKRLVSMRLNCSVVLFWDKKDILAYNLTGDPGKDNAYQIEFLKLVVLNEDPYLPHYVVICCRFYVIKPYHLIGFDLYGIIEVRFRDYNTEIIDFYEYWTYFYVFCNLYWNNTLG